MLSLHMFLLHIVFVISIHAFGDCEKATEKKCHRKECKPSFGKVKKKSLMKFSRNVNMSTMTQGTDDSIWVVIWISVWTHELSKGFL